MPEETRRTPGTLDAHAALAAFPGIVTRARRNQGSHVRLDGDRAIVALTFRDDIEGATARRTTAYIFARMGHRRLDGKAPVPPSAAPAPHILTPSPLTPSIFTPSHPHTHTV